MMENMVELCDAIEEEIGKLEIQIKKGWTDSGFPKDTTYHFLTGRVNGLKAALAMARD